MPEITSNDRIRAKLRDFDEKVDGAISAAKALAKVKSDAEGVFARLGETAAHCQQSMRAAEDARRQLNEVQGEWERLRATVAAAEGEFREKHDRALSEVTAARLALERDVATAEAGLRAALEASGRQQQERATKLEERARSEATRAQSAAAACADRAKAVEDLLGSVREGLLGDVHRSAAEDRRQVEEVVKNLHEGLRHEFAEFRGTVDRHLSEFAAKYKALEDGVRRSSKAVSDQAIKQEEHLRSEMGGFKEEMKRGLVDHHQAADRQMTEFLSKQNVLVQNLGQQIDSYQRSAEATGRTLQATTQQLGQLSSRLEELRGEAAAKGDALTSQISGLVEQAAALRSSLSSESQARSSALNAMASRLNVILQVLSELPFVGSKFEKLRTATKVAAPAKAGKPAAQGPTKAADGRGRPPA